MRRSARGTARVENRIRVKRFARIDLDTSADGVVVSAPWMKYWLDITWLVKLERDRIFSDQRLFRILHSPLALLWLIKSKSIQLTLISTSSWLRSIKSLSFGHILSCSLSCSSVAAHSLK